MHPRTPCTHAPMLPENPCTHAPNTPLQLRKEMRAASAELRKAASLSAANAPLDLGLSKDTPGMRSVYKVESRLEGVTVSSQQVNK